MDRVIIGVFDSGVGGLTTASKIHEMTPNAKIIYYNDHQHCPYGERSKSELLAITSEIVRKLQKQGVSIIVIACNTATTQCIGDLRGLFPDLHFIGTEPAIKVACDAGCGNILLMATPGTVKSTRINKLVNRQSASHTITLLPCPDLAKLIEDATIVEDGKPKFQISQDIKLKIAELLKNVGDIKQFDAVVLGCTHYVYIKDYLEQLFPHAQIFDGNLGVAQRVKELLERI